MPTVSAIRWTLTRRFCRTTVCTARQFSSQTASEGRLDRGSPSKLFLPRQNSAAQHFTMAYDGLSSPYTTVIQLCICCGETFCSVKNSTTARWRILLKSLTASNRLFSINCISQSKQAEGTSSLENTN